MAITPIGSGGLPQVGETIAPATGQPGKTGFGQVIEQLLNDASGQQVQADQAVQELAVGRSDDVHNVILAVAKADLSFRMILEVRNRLAEAYQEIMRMQV